MTDSYDEIPYQSIPFTDTHPENLAALGRLFGLDTPDPARSRVLELGCASGGNLIPLAFHLPEGRFHGVELAARQVEDGQRLLDELRLQNIRIERRDILDLGGDLGGELGSDIGEFDYIVTHGVYSWVPPAVQARILELCARHLAPQGIAYVSYNTWPGWRMRGILRDLLLYHTRGIAAPGEKLARALEFLAGFQDVVGDIETDASAYLLQELERLRTSHPSYLYHEYLEAWNQPQHVSEFIAAAERHGLQYVCDADLKGMFPSILGATVERWMEKYEELAEQEQYLDYISNRCFRQSLLCRADAPLSREIDLGLLERHAFFAGIGVPARSDLRSDKAEAFSLGAGKDIQVGHPLAKAALAQLSAAYPDAIAYPELFANAVERVRAAGNARAAADENGFQNELFLLFAHQAVGMTARPRRFPHGIPARPRAHRLARAQAEQNLGHLATARHSTIQLDPFSARLVGCLDGTRTASELVAQLTDDIRAGRLLPPGLKPAAPDVLATQVSRNVDRLLKLFARQGILEG
jgi:methyltransferase-like protein